MWIWIIIIAVVIGALVGFFNRGNIGDALGGAMAGGCLATGCLIRIAIAAIGILFILWLFKVLFY